MFARRPVALTGAAVVAVLLLLSGRYGYHRDELYFLACGRHLAWGYPDQPPLVPALARLMSEVSAHSLVVLRLPADLAAGATVVLTGAIANELGAGRRGQILAALAMAISNILLATGHLLSTMTFVLTCTAALMLIALRMFRTGDPRWWLPFGLVTGAGLLDSDLVGFVVGAVIIGVLVAGPRRLLVSWWLVAAAVVAGALWTPYLVWQAHHGWPQLTVARAIANGGSGTSAPRWQIVVMQFVLCSPPLVPIWITGLVRLCRGFPLRWCRALGIAYVVLLVLFLVSGGKPYYLASMFPLLLAAGAEPTIQWIGRQRAAARSRLVAAALVLAVIPDAIITLPLLPTSALHATPIVGINYDAGETLAWPTFVSQIARVYRRIPAAQRSTTAVLTENYGEAGAVQRYGNAVGLPGAFSGHNGFWLWGPPPATTRTVVAVGFDRARLAGLFDTVRLAGQLNNRIDVDDDEQGAPVWLCSGPTLPWQVLWPRLKRYG